MVLFENKLILVVVIILVVLNCVELLGIMDEFLKLLFEFVWKKMWIEINFKYICIIIFWVFKLWKERSYFIYRMCWFIY